MRHGNRHGWVLALIVVASLMGCGDTAGGDDAANATPFANNGEPDPADYCGGLRCGGGGTMCCEDTCVNVNTARGHCGMCGNACAEDEMCRAGVCMGSNLAPFASVGEDRRARVGATVTLDGSGSSDPDGDALTFAWTLDVPQGSGAALSGADMPMPTFVADVEGIYTATLVVSDGALSSTPAQIEIQARINVNNPPVAEAGENQMVTTGAEVTLDGGGSADEDGDAITYLWELRMMPEGSAATLAGADTQTPSFTADLDGDYVAALIVNDGTAPSMADTVTVTAAPEPNATPVADGGDDHVVIVGTEIMLDGSASSDEDGDALTYLWAVRMAPDTSMAALTETEMVMTSFTPDLEGEYVVTLVVNDGTIDSEVDRVMITATPLGNTPPVADAGMDTSVTLGMEVTLDGSGSMDADMDALTYAWTIATAPAGSTATLTGDDTATPSFTPDVEGDYIVELVVNDGSLDSAASTVTVSAAPEPNTVPVANAGADASVEVGIEVTLDGSGSMDADMDTLSYAWTIAMAPGGSTAALTGATTAMPTLTPDVAGEYVIELVVNDGTDDSSPDAVTITGTGGNAPPTADAGADASVGVGMEVTLDGSGSMDADMDTLAYAWTITMAPGGSTAALMGATTAMPTLTPDVAGEYVIELVVNDGTADSNPDTVTITAADGNAPPTANAGGDASVEVGTEVTLDGSGSMDADMDTLSYAWTITMAPGGSTATLTGADTEMPTLTPDVAGEYVIELVVNDGTVDSSADSVTITATAAANQAPTACTGADQSVTVSTLVTLDGSCSADPEMEALTYAWTITMAPGGSTAALTDADMAMATFTPDVAGEYVITLTVDDPAMAQDSTTTTITVTE